MLSVDAQTFLPEVEDASRITPVVVDFWGENCGPCKALASVLERLEPEFIGRIKLVKFDVGLPDHQELSSRWGVRGIPTLIAFSRGEPVRRSVGNLRDPELRNFFKAVLAGTGDVQAAFRTGVEALEKGDRARGIAVLRDALESDPSHVESRLTLLLETGRNPVPVDEKALEAVTEDLWRLFPQFAILAATAYPLEIEALQLRMNGLTDRVIMPSTSSLHEQLRTFPKDDWTRMMLARLLIAEGAFQEAADLALQGLEFGNAKAFLIYYRTFRAAHILAGTWNDESEQQMERAMARSRSSSK